MVFNQNGMFLKKCLETFQPKTKIFDLKHTETRNSNPPKQRFDLNKFKKKIQHLDLDYSYTPRFLPLFPPPIFLG